MIIDLLVDYSLDPFAEKIPKPQGSRVSISNTDAKLIALLPITDCKWNSHTLNSCRKPSNG